MTLRQRWAQTSLPNKFLVATGAVVALSSVIQMLILWFSLQVSNAALEASIESSHNDQRAWIAVKNMSITSFETGKPLKTEVKIINTGKTNALEVQESGVVGIYQGKMDVEKYLKETPPPEHEPVVLFQGIDVAIPAETSAPLTEEQIKAIQDRRYPVYLFGDVHYKDIFKKSHITQYCGIFVPAINKFEACPQHNKVD
jgi:hypothetical protein